MIAADSPMRRAEAEGSAADSLRVTAVILNYKTAELTIQCLASLEPEHAAFPGLRAIVVDNCSPDGSADVIAAAIAERGWSDWAELVRSEVNAGFSAGNNVGIRADPDADIYWLLNSDTIIRPGALRELTGAAVQHPEAGLLSPRLEWPDGDPQISCFRFHKRLTPLCQAAKTGLIDRLLRHCVVAQQVFDAPVEVDWTSFASVMIRRRTVEVVGLLDEGYFMYFEDVDYCRRAWAAGLRVLHWPAARVVHLRGQSGTVKSSIRERKRPPAFLYASRARYYAKFYRRTGLLTANLAWCLGRGVSLLRERLGGRDPAVCERQARDIWIGWRDPLGDPPLPPGASRPLSSTPGG